MVYNGIGHSLNEIDIKAYVHGRWGPVTNDNRILLDWARCAAQSVQSL